ncbi:MULTISPECIES: Ig-like domain-containing protein [unclassified Streptomyces]|uniref:L,D-transpeptidase n=1 Tax=unclassified Streptomyces TaxID=2593676 RepID=UPI0003804BA9|nr:MULTISPECIES: Ig-like domain-containing protein [unclassified Streptomyces]MYR66679.1 L,D-transpeptidase family protein [Streptomyces sp. SID4939]MYS03182.1 L,D-transpeptidase family protein [Streptomyces sp. SID4940]MYT66925.1 L,D-transpeptidase family protein [Streptomyces sp. SID8357]MYT88298.1 L,D-transpeptidase family protein [Streptomyces sp. SID8360]MYW39489.1 L,D-transpeptidase family protein [Streptomyces sp. SID1]
MEKRVMTDSKRRRGLVAASALLGGVLVLSACSDDGGSGTSAADSSKTSQAQVDEAAAKAASEAKITIAPKNGAINASINNAAMVTVAKGKLTEVTMTTSEGKAVEGTLAGDGSQWKPNGQLERSTTYKISATATDSEGRQAHANSSFTTVSPENSFIGNFTPEDGSTVGVGMPVSINFNKAITNQKAVQDGITVTSSSGQEVVGHWFNNQRLDLRPEDYWQSGSTVTLKLALDGVEGADGVVGVQQKTVTFKVGRNQVSTVDTKAHTMTVTRDGKTIKTIPISAGSPDNPTYNGQMVISEKYKETHMDGATVGFTDDDGKSEYDITDVPHAMRLSSSGTFIHGNYWGKGIFGSVNTSHGCVGLADAQGADDPDTAGAWFYNNSMIGDVVVVKNSPDKTIAPDNGLNGWNMSWSEWTAGSAG